MDDAAAEAFLREFVAEVQHWEAMRPSVATSEHGKGLEAQIRERLPAVERIVEAVEPDRNFRWTSPGESALHMAMRNGERAVGVLENRGQVEAILGPAGPRLSASQLHPWVWEAAARLWDDGHRRAAVQTAATQVEVSTQAKLGRYDVNGVDIWRQALTADDPRQGAPRLRFPGFASSASATRRSSSKLTAMASRVCDASIEKVLLSVRASVV